MKRFDAVVNFSGGFDSTFVAYNYLLNNPDKKLLLHHCYIKRTQRRKRADKEWSAVRRICKWFKENGLTNFELVKTSWENEEIESTCLDQFFVNTNLIALLSPDRGSYKAKYEAKTILLCFSSYDRENPTAEVLGQTESNAEKLFKTRQIWLPDLICEPKPIEDMTREEVIRSLPPDLRKLPFFCQFFGRQSFHGPCGKCNTCLETLQYLGDDNE